MQSSFPSRRCTYAGLNGAVVGRLSGWPCRILHQMSIQRAPVPRTASKMRLEVHVVGLAIMSARLSRMSNSSVMWERAVKKRRRDRSCR
jgi:hypothetical protein